jgi:hypothetical protein
MNLKPRPSYTEPVHPSVRIAAYQPLPLSDATLRMIDQAIANDQAGILGHKFLVPTVTVGMQQGRSASRNK